jgi:hypothetical protein
LAAAGSILAAEQTCFKGSANSFEIYYSSVAVYLNKITSSQFTSIHIATELKPGILLNILILT